MAIQCKITTIHGVQLPSAYINFAPNPQIVKQGTETGNSYKLSANACIYASKAAYDAGKIPVEGFSVVCDLDLTGNVLEQGYAKLKQNERLSEIIDC